MLDGVWVDFQQKEPCEELQEGQSLERGEGLREMARPQTARDQSQEVRVGMSAVARAPGPVDLLLFYFFILYPKSYGKPQKDFK